jgi:hypothetical protein
MATGVADTQTAKPKLLSKAKDSLEGVFVGTIFFAFSVRFYGGRVFFHFLRDVEGRWAIMAVLTLMFLCFGVFNVVRFRTKLRELLEVAKS